MRLELAPTPNSNATKDAQAYGIGFALTPHILANPAQRCTNKKTPRRQRARGNQGQLRLYLEVVPHSDAPGELAVVERIIDGTGSTEKPAILH